MSEFPNSTRSHEIFSHEKTRENFLVKEEGAKKFKFATKRRRRCVSSFGANPRRDDQDAGDQVSTELLSF